MMKWKKSKKKYGKMKKAKDLKGYKEKAKQKINDIVDKIENKIFDYIKDILIEEKEENELKFEKFDKNCENCYKKID